MVRGKVDQYFKARFNSVLVKARKERQERAKKDPKAFNEPLTIAFDSTSISTHSDTIDEAEYGKAKDDPELKQVNLTFANLTFACDQKTGEVLYAREYEGSINDVASFSSIFTDMKEVGFHVEDVEIVTDRGYKAPYNIQVQLDAGVTRQCELFAGLGLRHADSAQGRRRGLAEKNKARTDNGACAYAPVLLRRFSAEGEEDAAEQCR